MKTFKISQQITKRETESFISYLYDVKKISKTYNLTREDEISLAKRIKNGDEKAKNELIESNLKFVISVAKQYQTEGVELGDLVNEGNIGLVHAAGKFDPDRNIKFISYAVWWIRQSILCYLNEDARFIRLPLNKISQLNKIKKAEEKFKQTYHRKPSNYELIETLEMDICPNYLNNLLLLNQKTQSLDVSPPSNDTKLDNFTLKDLLADDCSLNIEKIHDKNNLKAIANGLLKKVPPMQKEILEMYYGLKGGNSKTLDEIGIHFGLTRERIRQLKKVSIKKLSNETNLKIINDLIN
jgi:RNA polymerase primary sigma factor